MKTIMNEENWNITILLDIETNKNNYEVEFLLVLYNNLSSVKQNNELIKYLITEYINSITIYEKIKNIKITIKDDTDRELIKNVLSVEIIIELINKFLIEILEEYNS